MAAALVFICALLIVGDVGAQWSNDPSENLLICDGSGSQLPIAIVEDDAGGWIIIWEDYSAGVKNLHAQRIDREGYPQWELNGIRLDTTVTDVSSIRAISDSVGGAFIVWRKNQDVFAQRISPDGALLWGTGGIAVTQADVTPAPEVLMSDGLGGLILIWSEEDSKKKHSMSASTNLVAQRISSSGERLWSPSNGSIIVDSVDVENGVSAVVVGSDEFIVSWYFNARITCMKLKISDGTTSWRSQIVVGVDIHDSRAGLVGDGEGGAIVVFMDGYDGVRARRVHYNGTVVWTYNGMLVGEGYDDLSMDFTDYSSPYIPDSLGGAILAWNDVGPTGGWNVYARRVDNDGDLFPSSTFETICDDLEDQWDVSIIEDGDGGGIVIWEDGRAGDASSSYYARRITSSGVGIWQNNGNLVSDRTGYKRRYVAIGDQHGGAVIVWANSVGGENDLSAQRINGDGKLDAVAPVVSAVTDTIDYSDGDFTLETKLTDASGVLEATLYYGTTGTGVGTPVEMTRGDSIWTAVVPGSTLSASGLEYYVESTDSLFNTGTSQTIYVSVTGVSASHSLPSNSYRMVSVPIVPTDGDPESVFSELGSYNDTRWRFGRWSQGDSAYYHEFSVDWNDDNDNVEPGRGYWMIVDNSRSIDATGRSTVPTGEVGRESYYVVSLDSGWNQIGHPFHFDVAWDSVMVRKHADSTAYPIADDPFPLLDGNLFGWSSGDYDSETATLEAWKGYFVKSLWPGSMELLIPPVESQGATAKERWTGEYDTDWLIQLSARSDARLDNHNYIGTSGRASNTWDRMDRADPPPRPTSYLRLSFPHSDLGRYSGRLGTDIRSVISEGESWKFEVQTDLSLATVQLDFSGMETVPESYSTVLIDEAAGVMIDLRDHAAYEFNMGPSGEPREFQIVVGTEKYVEQAESGLPDVPRRFGLAQNYPNPFNPLTTIDFEIPAHGGTAYLPTSLKVYSLLGREVATLIDEPKQAGYHSATWNGRNGAGREVSSGVYFYRVVAGPYQETRRMVLLR